MSIPAAATPASPKSSLLPRIAIVAAFGGFLFGYDTAVINGANRYLTMHFGLTPFQEGLAGASAILGCIPGAMFAGGLSDKFGRRRVLFLCAILYAVSGFLSAIPATFTQFLIARFISGLGIGASSMICPVYIAELAPAEKRGRLGSLFQFGIVTGIFLTLFINARIQAFGDASWNTTLGWRWMLGAEVIPAIGFLLMLFVVPESPRWLIQRGRENEARGILENIGGPAHAETEIAATRASTAGETGGLRELFGARFRMPLLIAIVLMAVSQFSGINAIMYYSTNIFTAAGLKDAFSCSILVGLINLLFTLVAMVFVDKAGRRPLLIIGLAVQVLSLGAVGYMFHAGASGIPLMIGVLVFIAAFAMALGPIPWILCSEIFPNKIRATAMSLSTFIIWTSCYIVAQTFPMLNAPAPKGIGPAATFGVYAVFSLLGLIFVILKLPETKGRTLEEIAASWSKK